MATHKSPPARAAPSPRSASTTGREPPRLRRLAQRLRAALTRVLDAIPPEHRGVTRLSDWIGVPKPICFRVIDAQRLSAEPLDIINALPGVKGLDQTLGTIAARVNSRAVSTAAAEAVEVYHQLLDTLGGSQAQARRTIAALLRAPASDSAQRAARKAAFESARGITGVWSDTLAIAQCIAPHAPALTPALDQSSSPLTLQHSVISGHIGLRAGHAHFPVTFAWRSSDHVAREMRSLDADRPLGLNAYALVTEFSTNPFPRIVTEGESGYERDVIDWRSCDLDDAPADVFIGLRGCDVRQPAEPLESHAVTRIPTRRVVIDLLIPRSLGFVGPAHGAAFFIGFGGTVKGSPASRWHDLLHELDQPLDSLNHPDADFELGYPRNNDVVDYLLSLADGKHANQPPWERRDFRHLRWTVQFPIWGCDYSIRIHHALPPGIQDDAAPTP